MQFTVSKKITRGKNWLLLKVLLILYPIIVLLTILFFMVVIPLQWILKKLGMMKIKPVDRTAKTPFEYRKKFMNETVEIKLEDDQKDISLIKMQDKWKKHYGLSKYYIFKLKTDPTIPEIENMICTAFLKEFDNGLLLQRLITPPTNPKATLESELVYFDYEKRTLQVVENIGAFILHDIKDREDVIGGVNRTHKLELKIQPWVSI